MLIALLALDSVCGAAVVVVFLILLHNNDSILFKESGVFAT